MNRRKVIVRLTSKQLEVLSYAIFEYLEFCKTDLGSGSNKFVKELRRAYAAFDREIGKGKSK